MILFLECLECGVLVFFVCDFCEKKIWIDDIIFCFVLEMDEEVVWNFFWVNFVFLEDYVMKYVD